MSKKYLIIGGIIVVIVVVIGFIFSMQNQKQQQASTSIVTSNQSAASVKQSQGSKVGAPSISMAAPASTPSEAAKQFYKYYFSFATNPLANGAYKNNPYLAPDFKDVISAEYSNGNDPVFCSRNKRPHITVGDEKQLPYNDQYLMIEVISDASTGKQLYRVSLQNVGGKWLIFDINCVY